MMKLTQQTSALSFLLVVLLISACTFEQKFELTPGVRRHAIGTGRIREFLTAMEAFGSEAERSDHWEDAAQAYFEATYAAEQMRQLQKAIADGTKTLEMAEKAKDPWIKANVMLPLARAYTSLGQFEKAKELLEKGLEVSKQITDGSLKGGIQARLYSQLGGEFLRQGDVQKAIEYISFSVQRWDSDVSFYKGHRYVRPEVLQTQESNLVGGLNQLGTAYILAGNAQEAIKTFERGIAITKTSRANATDEASLYHGLGQAYFLQKDFPHALENFFKALQMAEARRQTSVNESASTAMGDVFLQTQREAEAIPYYKKAVASIESTRSLLQSEELRTSFFANKGQTYDGIILAELRTENREEAFNYNERARSRAFLDILGSKVQLGRQTSLTDEERFLQGRISELRARLGGQGDDGGGES